MDIRPRFSCVSSPRGRRGASSSRGNPWVWHELHRGGVWLLREFCLVTEFCTKFRKYWCSWVSTYKMAGSDKDSNRICWEDRDFTAYIYIQLQSLLLLYKTWQDVFFPLTVNICRLPPVGLAWNRSFCVCSGGLAPLRQVCAGMVLWWSAPVWPHLRLGFAFFHLGYTGTFGPS